MADIPQWKKHLIARLRDQNKNTTNYGNPAVTVTTTRQLSPPFSSSSTGRLPNKQTSAGIRPSSSTCDQLLATSSATNQSKFSSKNGTSALSSKKKMVQERAWTVDYTSCESVDMVSETYSKTSDSDSSEELHYGPGIVNKLKNKYLSLALRKESFSHQRPSILALRKATSLEDLLDDGGPKTETVQIRPFKTNGVQNSTNRYRSPKRCTDMKRARSVETISRFENIISPPPKVEKERPKSLHDYILIGEAKEGNDKSYRKPKDSVENETNNMFSNNNYVPRPNRPKRITPVMNEREKPPTDVVKQAKMIFEKRPEQRTKPPIHTGDVAAKIASYKNIIVQSKPVKKPTLKTKPTLNEKTVKNNTHKNEDKLKTEHPKVTPRVKSVCKKTQKPPDDLTQLPNLPSPIPDVSLVNSPKSDEPIRLCETPDLILTTSPIAISTPHPSGVQNGSTSPTFNIKTEELSREIRNPENVPDDFIDSVLSSPIDEPLKLIINDEQSRRSTPVSPSKTTRRKISSPPFRSQKESPLDRVVEKNLINVAKNLEIGCEKKNDVLVPKKVRKPPREPETNSIVFKFTDRKDVPDYVQNDKTWTAGRLEKPKVGEGGIILLPGASLDESLTDEDEEIMRYLQAPPSPCDVTFINDNILIDGKSSINQKTKKCRMRISFIESGPDIYEYPSENSLLIDEKSSPVSTNATAPMAGHTVPMLSGSTLANYTPKSTEEFQLGVTRTIPTPEVKQDLPEVEQPLLEELDEPVAFSAGANSDMLF